MAPVLCIGLLASLSAASATLAQATSRPPIAADEPWVVYQGGTVAVGAGGLTPLHLVRADGTDDHMLLPVDPRLADVGHPDWSPDGGRIAFDVWTAQATGRHRIALWTVSAEGDDAREVAACELPCLQLAYPAWSPDGGSVAYARYDIADGGAWEPSVIEVLDLATGTRRVVARTPDGTSAYYDPRWSPDGTSMTATFETYTDAHQGTPTSSSVVVIDALGEGTTGGHTVITPPHLVAAQPAWGPNGTIVFLTTSALGAWPEAASVMLIGADGTGPRPLVDDPSMGVPVDPSWTSDGRIMFTLADRSGSHIATVAPDGTGLEIATWSLQLPPGSVQRTYARPRPIPTATS
jgi:Tol biopolymer transport system component